MYIQKGGVKLCVVNESGNEVVVACLARVTFWAREAWRVSRSGWDKPRPLHRPPFSLLRKTSCCACSAQNVNYPTNSSRILLAHNIRVEEDLID